MIGCQDSKGREVPFSSWKGLRMADQKGNNGKGPDFRAEDGATIAARKAKKYLLNQEMLAKLEKKRLQERRGTRRYIVNTELLEANGNPGNGSRIIDLSMNGARLELPFSPPFMSQMILKFALPESTKILRVAGRVVWTRTAFQRGKYEVGVQFYQNNWEIDQILRLQTR
jgi:hypothetical protein